MKPKIFSGTSNSQLAEAIVKHLGLELGKVKLANYPDGEINVEFLESVRGFDVFVIQTICPPVNDNLMQLLIMLDALKRSSPYRVTAVIPYYGYSRQDRKHGPREPITAKLCADLISVAGPQRLLFLDLHAIQIQGFFNIPADDISPNSLIESYLKEKKLDGFNTTIVAVNSGGARRARKLARMVDAKIALIESRIVDDKQILNVVGSLDKNCVIIDDMIDTGKRACDAAKVLKAMGAERVYLWATHAVLSGNVDPIEASCLDEVVITDSIPVRKEKQFNKLQIRSVASLISKAILRIHEERPISELFK